MSRFVIIASVVGFAAFACGCADEGEEPDACSLIGGKQGLHVTPDSALPTGDFAVLARADGQTLSVDITVNWRSDGEAEWYESQCPTGCYIAGPTFFDVSPGAFIVGYSAGGGPATVEIEVLSGGTDTIARQSYAPVYTLNTPNGPDCPPHLYQAFENIAINAP